MRLTLHRTPGAEIRDALLVRLDRFNDEATGRAEPVRHLSIVLRNGAGAVEGGLVGISYYDWLIVEMLFVPPGLRGHGLGTRLMRAAEAVAVRRGCRGVWLDTASPAARAFYVRLGYAVFATLPDHPRGHARWWMARTPPRDGEAGGLEIMAARDPAVVGMIGRALNAEADTLFGPDTTRADLAITAEDAAGANQGGLWMLVRRGWLFLDMLVLAPGARRGGTGRRILTMAEDEARARGCAGVWLDTFGFQAPEFYRRQGYRAFGALADYPAPHGRHWFRTPVQSEGDA